MIPPVLIASRTDDVCKAAESALAGLARVVCVHDIEGARARVRENFLVAMIDMEIHGGGLALVDEFSGVAPDTHILLFGAQVTSDQLERAINRHVAGFMRLPMNREKLRETVIHLVSAPPRSGALGQVIADLHTEARERQSMLLRTRRAGLLALAHLAEHRDPETGLHVERVGAFATLLATLVRSDGVYASQVTDEFLGSIHMAAALHDIGKVAVPDAILRKPTRLTPEEFVIMQGHCVKGWEVIESARREEGGHDPQLRLASEVVRWHHEKWDGSGYPDGLTGEQIPFSARIVAVIDAYDAMRSRRAYVKALGREDALAEMRRCIGGHFDPAIADVFLHHADEFEALGHNVDRITARWT